MNIDRTGSKISFKKLSHYKIIISSQYFLCFGIMGIFLPYFNLYCYHLGFSGFQIGLLSAVRTGVIVLFTLFWGVLADRFQIRRPIYILCNFISAGIWALYIYTTDFCSMVVITACYAIFYAPIISFLEAFTIDILGHEKKSYGMLRAWGSMAFITSVVALGKIIDLFSIEIIIVLIFVGSLVQAFVSIKIPGTKSENSFTKKSFAPIVNIFSNRKLIIFLCCAFLMLVSHGAYYAFFSIHLSNLGYGSTFIGITWALASTAEIIVMIKSDRILKRFSLENLLAFSFLVAALRWFILFFATSSAVILLLQTLHAVTYATFHIASILYIDSLTPAETKTTGQAVNSAVTYGLGMTVGVFISGCLYEIIDLFTIFALSGFIAFAGGVVFKGSQIIGQRS